MAAFLALIPLPIHPPMYGQTLILFAQLKIGGMGDSSSMNSLILYGRPYTSMISPMGRPVCPMK